MPSEKTLNTKNLAALGPLALAHAFQAAGDAVEKRKRGDLVAIGLFALSPLPPAQLFEAAGLAGVRLAHFTAAFFAGRIVSYSIYAATTKGIEQTSMGESFRHYLTSPVGIGLEILMLALLVAFTQVDWEKRLGGKKVSGDSATQRSSN